MRKHLLAATLAVLTTCAHAQTNGISTNQPFRLSLITGVNSLLKSANTDSVFFLQKGFNLALEGSYYWNSFGFSGRVGYMSNGLASKKISDFGISRKATTDRANITGKD